MLNKLKENRLIIGKWFLLSWIIMILLFLIFINTKFNPNLDRTELILLVINISSSIMSLIMIIDINLKIRNYRRGVWKDVI